MGYIEICDTILNIRFYHNHPMQSVLWFIFVISRAGDICQTTGILEIWSFNHDVIRTLTQQQILDDVNSVTIRYAYVKNYLLTFFTL